MTACFANYLALVAGEGKDPLAVEDTVDHIEQGFITPDNWNRRATGLLCGHVQSGKTSHVLGVVAKTVDLEIPLIVYLTSDNISLYEQTLADCMKAVAGRGVQVLCEADEGKLVYCSSTVLVVLKKNVTVLSKWLRVIKFSNKFRYVFIVDDEADAASLDTKQNVASNASAIHQKLCALKQQGQEGSLFLQVTATPQANLLLPNSDPLKPTYWTTFEPGASYKGGVEIYMEPKCVSHIEDKEGEILKEGKLPVGLRDAFIYFIVVATNLKERGKWARMLVHPSHLQSMHNDALKLLDALRLLLISELHKAKTDNRLPIFVLEVLSTRANYIDVSISPDALLETLATVELSVFNSNSEAVAIFDADKKPLHKNQVLIGGNILGRGLRIPQLQVVYYCRTTKTPQFDTMWQHSRVFGYDRDIHTLKVFVDKPTHKLFMGMAESSALLLAFIKNNALCDVSLKLLSAVNPTRKNVIPKKYYLALAGGTHYFTKNIQDYTQDFAKLSLLLALAGTTSRYAVIRNEQAVALLECMADDYVLDLVKVAILAYTNTVYVKTILGKHSKDGYRSILSETEHKASNTASPSNFVLTFCELQLSLERKELMWVVDVRVPDNQVFSRTIAEG